MGGQRQGDQGEATSGTSLTRSLSLLQFLSSGLTTLLANQGRADLWKTLTTHKNKRQGCSTGNSEGPWRGEGGYSAGPCVKAVSQHVLSTPGLGQVSGLLCAASPRRNTPVSCPSEGPAPPGPVSGAGRRTRDRRCGRACPTSEPRRVTWCNEHPLARVRVRGTLLRAVHAPCAPAAAPAAAATWRPGRGRTGRGGREEGRRSGKRRRALLTARQSRAPQPRAWRQDGATFRAGKGSRRQKGTEMAEA